VVPNEGNSLQVDLGWTNPKQTTHLHRPHLRIPSTSTYIKMLALAITAELNGSVNSTHTPHSNTANISQRDRSSSGRFRRQPILLHLQSPVHIMPRGSSELGLSQPLRKILLDFDQIETVALTLSQEQNEQSGSRGEANFVWRCKNCKVRLVIS